MNATETLRAAMRISERRKKCGPDTLQMYHFVVHWGQPIQERDGGFASWEPSPEMGVGTREEGLWQVD
jgi:hypothetical protein